MSADRQATFERRLSDLLWQVTPEPPRQVTVEDIAFRLANQNAAPRERAASRIPRPRLGSRGSGGGRRRWIPALAAAGVLVVAGTSAGVAMSLSSHKTPATVPLLKNSTSATTSPSPANPAATSAAPTVASSSAPAFTGPSGTPAWGGAVATSRVLLAGTLTAADGHLFALTQDHLVQLNPATGQIERKTSYPSGFPDQPPVVSGGVVWLVWNYTRSGGLVLRGFSAGTLAAAGTVTVPDPVFPSSTHGLLAAAPGGDLWVAAGNSVKLVHPASGAVRRSIPSASVNAVAAAPDGRTVYAGSVSGSSTRITGYSTSTGHQAGTVTVPAMSTGTLVASPGGVWLTTSGGVWFAPAGKLASARKVSGSTGQAQDAMPSYSGGSVWVGGSSWLECLNPSTGKLLARAKVPATSIGVPQNWGNVAVAGKHAYALFTYNGQQWGGTSRISPPAACAG